MATDTDRPLEFLANELVELLGWWDGEWMGPPHIGICTTKQQAIRAWVHHAKEQSEDKQ